MIHPRNVLNAVFKVDAVAEQSNLEPSTFSNITLFTLVATAEAIGELPPALQLQVKRNILAAMDEVVAPALAAYDPDLLLVSAGFDAHEHDPISRMRVSTEGYALLTERMQDIRDDVGCPLAFVLEGGYGLDVLAESVQRVHQVFDGYEPVPVDADRRLLLGSRQRGAQPVDFGDELVDDALRADDDLVCHF